MGLQGKSTPGCPRKQGEAQGNPLGKSQPIKDEDKPSSPRSWSMEPSLTLSPVKL